MMFRVRESLFGKSILQISDGDEWRDAFPSDLLRTGFNVTEVGVITRLHERIDIAESRLMEYAATVALARRQRKKLPVLSEVV
jgi:hypothetical protein